MSATPRTQQYRDGLQRADIDYHEMYESMVHFSETLENELGENEYAVDSSFARELETELASMSIIAERWEADALRYAKNAEYWQSRAEKAEADTARLDWLDKNGREHGGYGPMWRISWEYGQPDTLRAAIDATMKEASK